MKGIQQEISICINQLLIKEPFYAHLLSGVNRIYSDEIDTAAVGFSDSGIVLYINPHFFLKELSGLSQRVAVLKHETLHLVFKHLYRDNKFKNHKLLNIAADLVVNQYIGKWKLPDSAVTLSTFPKLNLEAKQNMEYYYNILKKNYENKSSESFESIVLVMNQNSHGNHSKWGDSTSSSNLFPSSLLNKKITDALKRTPSKMYGSLQGDLIDYIQSLVIQKPKISWRRVLRMFANANGRSYVSHTMKRVSARYGTRPGIRIKRLWNLCLVIDTSGSIDNKTLQTFLSEINHIHKCGAEITLIQCDATVQSVSKYSPRSEIKVLGGGGTNFDPVFELIKTSKYRFGGVIYFTDGYASEPKVKINTPLLWVITPDGDMGDHLVFGKKIKMP
jgi:predicted metal-dependent peptidase